jgi:hypothetical protein
MVAKNKIYFLFAVLLALALACNAPTGAVEPTAQPETVPPSPVAEEPTPMSDEVVVVHVQTPSPDAASGRIIHDVESSGTGPEGRAPYGDSYDINLFERPFLQDMTYVPDLDIKVFSLAQDDDWYYVSIKTIGDDPNNPMGIHFAVELDMNRDGFGDFIVVAQPPYTSEWTASNVQVFADQNKDTAGVSALKSDAPFDGDGYETLIFDIAQGVGDDPDLAWVRMVNDEFATIQFAFKKSWAGGEFMMGVMTDAGLKDVSRLDYVNRFTEAEAGSPVRNKQHYPLKILHSVDNTCREAFGFSPTGFEPRLCPRGGAPSAGGSGDGGGSPGSPMGCIGISPSDCAGTDSPFFWPFPHCACSSTPFYESPP